MLSALKTTDLKPFDGQMIKPNELIEIKPKRFIETDSILVKSNDTILGYIHNETYSRDSG